MFIKALPPRTRNHGTKQVINTPKKGEDPHMLQLINLDLTFERRVQLDNKALHLLFLHDQA